MYRRKTLAPPQTETRTATSKQIVSRNDGNRSQVSIQNKSDLKLFISSNPQKIYTSVCLCIVMNTDDNLETFSTNLSLLQTLFDRTFIVFVVHTETKITEWCKKHENSITIETQLTEEWQQRNLYLKFVHDNRLLFDLMMVVDPQISLMHKIKQESFQFLRNNEEFSAIFANQTYKYYDIESLVDEKKQVYTITDLEVKKKKIKQYQVHIPKQTGMIPVKSAFGGLAVYRTRVLDPDNKYTTDGHISFNLNISTRYSKLFIDPSFLIETHPNNSFLYEK